VDAAAIGNSSLQLGVVAIDALTAAVLRRALLVCPLLVRVIGVLVTVAALFAILILVAVDSLGDST
jgi:hypothetical protein